MGASLWPNVDEETWSSFDVVAPGIHIYRDVFPQNLITIDILEKALADNNDGWYWSPAKINHNEVDTGFRDCSDFKFMESDYFGKPTEKNAVDFYDLHKFLKHRQLQAVKHYAGIHGIPELRYWEATNFVKYETGQHFTEHTDHGFSYNCTVSLIGYLNDDYEGGELEFRFWNLLVKPKAGDLFIFPSNFMYPHRALPVLSGTKYSVVTMLDYSGKFHTGQMHSETEN